jgi:diguanylate cyclase (GGDEF)-like protein
MERSDMRDELTGLVFIGTFQKRLQEELARANQQGQSVALLIADLDDFKVFNDTNGHRAGDQLLLLCADLVRETIGAGDILARYGGDEFAIIMPDTTLQHALLAAERIRIRIERARPLLMVEGVTVSLGVANYPEHATEGDALIGAADKALYVAKRLGKNQVRAAGYPGFPGPPL